MTVPTPEEQLVNEMGGKKRVGKTEKRSGVSHNLLKVLLLYPYFLSSK